MVAAYVARPALVPFPVFFCGSGAVVAVLLNGMRKFGNIDVGCCYDQPITCRYFPL